jgi:hypothetical protein
LAPLTGLREAASTSLLVIALVLVLAVPAAAAGSPVLGSAGAFTNGKGFGQVKPREVYLGGDPTGDVKGVRWHGWGAKRAIGFGTGWCSRQSVADGYYCGVSLHVYDLGSCHGRPAYRKMVFYFKPSQRKHWQAGAKLNICAGRYI